MTEGCSFFKLKRSNGRYHKVTMKPQLIIVQGIPGSGKTTLSRKLAKDLNLPCIGKDDIKELYFEKMGTGDREWSRTLGRASANALFMLVNELLPTGKQFIAENAYWAEFAHDEFKDALSKANATALEIYCHTDSQVRRKRFLDRMHTGERHEGHVEMTSGHIADEDELVLNARYAPLEVGEVIRVDTTSFGEPEYQELLQRLRSLL